MFLFLVQKYLDIDYLFNFNQLSYFMSSKYVHQDLFSQSALLLFKKLLNLLKTVRSLNKHAKCVSESRKDSKTCTKDLKAALEIISDIQWDKRISTSCCAFKRFEDCVTTNLRTKCGDEAVEISRKLVRLAASRLPEIVCQSYKGDKCAGLLPPSGTAPTGAKSNSILSRVFSKVDSLC
uniref:DUF19 domain-containing protein n=1 Tax=Tetranychus urticae TaxID=32264 RepID=T1JYE3_TETUR